MCDYHPAAEEELYHPGGGGVATTAAGQPTAVLLDLVAGDTLLCARSMQDPYGNEYTYCYGGARGV